MALVPMTDAVLGGTASSADNNAIIDNVLDLDARLGAVTSGSTAHARLNALEARTTDTATAPGGIGNQRLADRLDTGVGTGSNVTTGSASAQLGNLRSRVTTLEGSATVDTAGRIVARGNRATSSSTSSGGPPGAEVAVLRVAAALVSGRVYAITFPLHVLDSTGSNDGTAGIQVRWTTSGNATVASTLVPGAQYFAKEGMESMGFAVFIAASTATHSFLLTVFKSAGTGSLSLYADASRLIELVITDAGVDPGDTGVDL